MSLFVGSTSTGQVHLKQLWQCIILILRCFAVPFLPVCFRFCVVFVWAMDKRNSRACIHRRKHTHTHTHEPQHEYAALLSRQPLFRADESWCTDCATDAKTTSISGGRKTRKYESEGCPRFTPDATTNDVSNPKYNNNTTTQQQHNSGLDSTTRTPTHPQACP